MCLNRLTLVSLYILALAAPVAAQQQRQVDQVEVGTEKATARGQEGSLVSRGQGAEASARPRIDDSGQSARSLLAAPWFTFRSPDGDFTLDFPRKPERGKDVEGPISVVRNYDVYTDRLDFHLNFQDMGGDPDAPDRNEFGPDEEEVLASSLHSKGSYIIRIQRVARNIDELEVSQLSPVDPGQRLYSIRRTIIYRARVYTLGCGSIRGDEQPDRAVCQRFFNSFRFSKAVSSKRPGRRR
jgi:hypothetical protein